MRVTVHATASAFLDAVRPVLAEHEAEHHLVLGVAEAVARGSAQEPDLFAVTFEDESGLALAAWMGDGKPLLLASDRPGIAPAATTLADLLGEQGRAVQRVIGAVDQVETFADEWTRRTGQPGRVAMRQRVYRLDAVEPIGFVAGRLRAATLDDLDLVTTWRTAFEAEALGFLPPSVDRSNTAQRIREGGIYLWCDVDSMPRAMAGSARPTARAIAVNAVYTPLEWRGRGYATACVAELSRHLLGSGFEFCVLYTDLENPTSNAIYTRIGYRPVRDFLMYHFGIPDPKQASSQP